MLDHFSFKRDFFAKVGANTPLSAVDGTFYDPLLKPLPRAKRLNSGREKDEHEI